MKGHASIFSLNPTSPVEMTIILMKHRTLYTELTKKNQNFISDLKEFIEDTKKQFNEIKDKELKED